MTYSEKLRDPRWQKKRLEIFARDKWKCSICHSSEKELQVHHLVYSRRDPWDYPDECYQTLCAECHEERQVLTDAAIDALRMSLRNVPTARLQKAVQSICDFALERITP